MNNFKVSLFFFLIVSSLYLVSCNNKETQEQKIREDLLKLEDSIAKAKPAAIDSSCVAFLETLLLEEPVNYSKVDSILKASTSPINCYCQLTASHKKFGARIPVVKEFIKNKYKTREYEYTPIQIAINKGDLKLLSLLLKSGMDPNLSKNIQLKPLNLAVLANEKKMVNELATYKADLKGCYVYIRFLSTKELKKYKTLGADYSIVDPHFKVPPIQEAKDAEALDYLLALGIDPNSVNKDGDNLLHVLALESDLSSISLALKYKTDLYKKNSKGYTPLHIAASAYSIVSLKKLFPLYDLKKAGTSIEELKKIAEEFNRKDNLTYLEKQKNSY